MENTATTRKHDRLTTIILRGDDAILAELARQEAIAAEQLRKQFAAETKNTARFAYAAHQTKTQGKITRLINALSSEGLAKLRQADIAKGLYS